MSYDKQTLNESGINTATVILDLYGIQYTKVPLGTVGLLGAYDEAETYTLQMLVCDKFVMLERMIRTQDCDTDDVIVSKQFDPDKIPESWHLIKVLKDDEYGPAQDEYHNLIVVPMTIHYKPCTNPNPEQS